MTRRLLWPALLAAALTACSTPPETGEPPPPDFAILQVSELTTGTVVSEAQWLEDPAGVQDTLESLALQAAELPQRAELLFRAGEVALERGAWFEAYELYRRAQVADPTNRFEQILERVFFLGRLFCEGWGEKPSFLFGVSLRDRDFGVEILEKFQEEFDQHPKAPDALYFVGVAQEALGELELAIGAWEQLGRFYPGAARADDAEYRTAVAFLALSDGVEYDKRPLLTARARFKRYLDGRLQGARRTDAERELAALDERLASQQLGVVRFYLQRDEEYSALLYLRSILANYPGTEAADEAGELLATLPAGLKPPPAPPPPSGDDDGLFRRLLNPVGEIPTVPQD